MPACSSRVFSLPLVALPPAPERPLRVAPAASWGSVLRQDAVCPRPAGQCFRGAGHGRGRRGLRGATGCGSGTSRQCLRCHRGTLDCRAVSPLTIITGGRNRFGVLARPGQGAAWSIVRGPDRCVRRAGALVWALSGKRPGWAPLRGRETGGGVRVWERERDVRAGRAIASGALRGAPGCAGSFIGARSVTRWADTRLLWRMCAFCLTGPGERPRVPVELSAPQRRSSLCLSRTR